MARPYQAAKAQPQKQAPQESKEAVVDISVPKKGERGPSLWMLMGLMVVCFLVLGGVLVWMIDARISGQMAPEGARPSLAVSKSAYFSMGSFVVNLAQPGRARLMQTDIELRTSAGEEGVKALEANKAALRDKTILILSAQKADDLFTEKGKETLKEQIRDEAQKIMQAATGSKVVDEIYFTSFVMQ